MATTPKKTTPKPSKKDSKPTIDDRIKVAVAAGIKAATPHAEPKVESKPEPAKEGLQPDAKVVDNRGAIAGSVLVGALAIAIAVIYVGYNRPTTVPTIDTAAITAAVKAGLPATPPPATTPATPPATVQAVQVEVIPLTVTKTDTHAHVLHKQSCLNNEGKRVKVRVTHPVTGRLGWDWYTCPRTT